MRYVMIHTHTHNTAVSCLYIYVYGVCVLCVYDDDDVTESIFKMKIDNFLQYAER